MTMKEQVQAMVVKPVLSIKPPSIDFERKKKSIMFVNEEVKLSGRRGYRDIVSPVNGKSSAFDLVKAVEIGF